MKFLIFIFICFFSHLLVATNDIILISAENTAHSVIFVCEEDNKSIDFQELKKPNPVFTLFKKKQRLNKKITAAALAFPFPFGMVGLHRIYLGTKPHVPVAYIGTVGGVFGILPLIDFCKITFDKDLTQYQNNGKVFMWIEE